MKKNQSVYDLLAVIAAFHTTSSLLLKKLKLMGFPLPEREVKAVESIIKSLNR